MLEGARKSAESAATELRAEALLSMNEVLSVEVVRLRELAVDHEGPAGADAEALEVRKSELARVLEAAPMRLDAIRLIWRAPTE